MHLPHSTALCGIRAVCSEIQRSKSYIHRVASAIRVVHNRDKIWTTRLLNGWLGCRTARCCAAVHITIPGCALILGLHLYLSIMKLMYSNRMILHLSLEQPKSGNAKCNEEVSKHPHGIPVKPLPVEWLLHS